MRTLLCRSAGVVARRCLVLDGCACACVRCSGGNASAWLGVVVNSGRTMGLFRDFAVKSGDKVWCNESERVRVKIIERGERSRGSI
jgi:hypothetical protein